MKGLTFTDRLIEAIKEKKSILCVGLDPQVQYLPPFFFGNPNLSGLEDVARAFLDFNLKIIDAVEPYCVAVKLQMAFYEAYGHYGVWAFEETIRHAKSKGLIVIEDAKRGDGGDTAQAYANGHLGAVDLLFGGKRASFDVDALTIHAWIGESCVNPFIKVAEKHGKGIFVVTKTSFKPNSVIEQLRDKLGLKVWQRLAMFVDEWGQGTEGKYGYRNFGVVMGATYPEDAVEMRKILPNAWFLVPGYGAQGGGADGAVVGVNADGFGCVVNSSRGIIYAYRKDKFYCQPEKFAQAAGQAAKFARDDLNAALKRAKKFNW